MKKLKDSVTREMKEFAIAFYQHYADGHKQPVTVSAFKMPSLWPPEYTEDDRIISLEEAETLPVNMVAEFSDDGESWQKLLFKGVGSVEFQASLTLLSEEVAHWRYMRRPEGPKMQAKLVLLEEKPLDPFQKAAKEFEEGEAYVKKTTLPIQYQVGEETQSVESTEEKLVKNCFTCDNQHEKSECPGAHECQCISCKRLNLHNAYNDIDNWKPIKGY